jgi:hypothetical protein
MNQIYQCSEKDLSKLCIRELSAGEENGSVGYCPPSWSQQIRWLGIAEVERWFLSAGTIRLFPHS